MVGDGVERREVGMCARDLFEGLRLEDQEQGVLDRGAPVAGGPVLEKRAHAESLTGAHPVDEVAGLVAHLDCAGSDDVEAVPAVAHIEHDTAAARVAQRAPPRQSAQHLRGQSVERRVRGQEVPDLGQLDVHAPMVAPIRPAERPHCAWPGRAGTKGPVRLGGGDGS